jgi:hypothetical protein
MAVVELRGSVGSKESGNVVKESGNVVVVMDPGTLGVSCDEEDERCP